MLLLQLLEPGEEMGANRQRILLQALAVDHFEHRFPLRADDRVAAERVEMNPLRERVGDLCRRHHRRQRSSVADALGHGYDVRDDSLQLKAPIMAARPSKSGLNFIRDADATSGAN